MSCVTDPASDPHAAGAKRRARRVTRRAGEPRRKHSVPLDQANAVAPSPDAASGETTTTMRTIALAAGPAPWRYLCQAEIDNFALLRRHVGTTIADRLVDAMLAQIAARIPEAVTRRVSARLGEFEFGGETPGELESVLCALRDSFNDAVIVAGQAHSLEVTLAGAAAPAMLGDSVRLAEEAEQALSDAHVHRRPVVRDLTIGAPAFDRLSLIGDLVKAIDRNELVLHYQPKLHLRRQAVTSAEALIRWQHPTRGLIGPGEFVPVAEEMHEIAAMTLWTLARVISDQRMLRDSGHDITLFINISGQLLGDATFVARACQMIQVSEAKIGFEITETSVIRDPQTAIGNLQVFADMGIAIAIDDYGAGLSSLAYLKQMPARELKIDKMFVMQLTSSNRDPLIVRSTIDLAHAMEMEVTAEGVETQASLALLSVMGCDMVQGFLVGRPMPIEALMQYIEEKGHTAATVEPRAMFNRSASFWRSVS